MDICSDGHDPIAYSTTTCPCCSLINTYEDINTSTEEVINDLYSEIETLEKTNDTLQELVNIYTTVVQKYSPELLV